MHAVILAAGDGGRLRPLTSRTPKPLLALHGRPLISHVLDALHAAGVTRATIVVGYLGDQIRAALEDARPEGMSIDFVRNADFHAGNARSIWEARRAVDEPFLLAMADHLVEPSLVQSVVESHNGVCALAIEHVEDHDARSAEATRANVYSGRVLDLGKNILRWNALDTGVFWCTPDIFDAITPDLRNGEAGAVFAALARAGALDAIDVTGSRWLGVDTPDDLRAAESWFSVNRN
jgi:NDP-sugar pyrophosphorylase family protein